MFEAYYDTWTFKKITYRSLSPENDECREDPDPPSLIRLLHCELVLSIPGLGGGMKFLDTLSSPPGLRSLPKSELSSDPWNSETRCSR